MSIIIPDSYFAIYIAYLGIATIATIATALVWILCDSVLFTNKNSAQLINYNFKILNKIIIAILIVLLQYVGIVIPQDAMEVK